LDVEQFAAISGGICASGCFFLGLRIFSTPVIDYGSNIGFGNNFTAFLTYFEKQAR